MIPRWTILPTEAALCSTVIERIVDAANKAIAERGRFDIVLAGGSTPRTIYQGLCKAQTDWARWYVWFGDERCLPVEDGDRNSKMAYDAFLKHVAIPFRQIHVIQAELGAARAASSYNQQLGMLGDFDLVLLGMGEDGHTASLFPGHSWNNGDPAMAVSGAPKPPSERVSLTASRLSRSRQVLFIVTGKGKQEAINAWRRGGILPAAAITSKGTLEVFMDQQAAGQQVRTR
jgi:6-phosphogluconolactonase